MLTDHEVLRRTLLGLWIAVLAYFGLAWFASVGWIGPGWALRIWSLSAMPLYVVSLAFGLGQSALRRFEPYATLLSWALLLGLTYVPADASWLPPIGQTELGFSTLVAVCTVFPLLVTGRGFRLLVTARRPVVRAVRFPRRAAVSIGVVAGIAIAWVTYLAARPTYTFVVLTQPNAAGDAASVVWSEVLTVRTPRGDDLPEGVSSLTRTSGPNGAPAIAGRFRPGTSGRVREAVLAQLRTHPLVAAVDTGRAND
jgi:hypothetical protein